MTDTRQLADQRRLDLDWIRIGAFALLILYHVGMYYVPWDWHVKSVIQYDWLEPVMALTNPWRLTLLFIVSGAASRFMIDKMGAASFAWARTVRLFVPLLFGMLVIVPPQTWLQVAQLTGGSTMGYEEFYVRYLSGTGGWFANGVPLSTPTWNHLWFVVYLLSYTLFLAIARLLWRGLPQVASAAATRLLIAGGVAAPAVWFIGVHLILHPRFPETHSLFGDWSIHAESFGAFLFGFAIAKAPAAWDVLEGRRRPLAMLAGLANVAYAGTLALWIAGLMPESPSKLVMSWAFGLDQWLTTAAILAYASRYLRRFDHPCRQYLTQAIFPFYIVHQTLIIGAAAALRPLRLHPAVEALIIVSVTAFGCVATFEVVRRLPVIRPLFGLKYEPRNPRSLRTSC